MQTVFEKKTISIPCPDCNEMSSEPIERVVDNDVIPCSLCGGLIDLANEKYRPLIEQAKMICGVISKTD